MAAGKGRAKKKAGKKRKTKKRKNKDVVLNYMDIVRNSLNAIAYHKIIKNKEGKPVDYIFVNVNPAFEKSVGLKKKDILNKKASGLFPGIKKSKAKLIEKYGKVALTGKAETLEFENKSDGRVFHIHAYSPARNYFITVSSDITQQKKLEAELKERDETIRSIIKAAPEGLGIIDKNRVVKWASDNMRTSLGLANEKFNSLPIRKIYPDEKEFKRAGTELYADIEKKGIGETEAKLKRGDGGFINALIRVAPLFPKAPEKGYAFAILDISEIKKYENVLKKEKANLKESEEKYKMLVDNIQEGIWLLNKGMKTMFVNKRMLDMFGYREQEMAGESVYDYIDEKWKKTAARWFENKTGPVKENCELKFRKKSGESFYALVSTAEIRGAEGNYAGALASVVDISEQKTAEFELEQAFTKLVRANRLKSNFLSIISHELRTPITVIKGFLTFLLRKAAGSLNEKQMDFLNTIDSNTDRLKYIINDLVDVSKIEQGIIQIEKEDFDICPAVEQVVEELRVVAAAKKINLKFEEKKEGVTMYADKGRIQQVIINLINNAVKFSPGNSEVIVSLDDLAPAEIKEGVKTRLKEGADYIMIRVCDSGPGIAPEHADKIFEKFYQVENPEIRRHRGAGLGLSIAKNIVEAHEGFIWCENQKESRGSIFNVLLPSGGGWCGKKEK